jgi:hypothetical protein
MDSLCDDIIYQVLKLLFEPQDIGNAHFVSRKFNQLLQANYLWRYYYEKYSSTHISGDQQSGSSQIFHFWGDASYKSRYMRCYEIELLISKLNIKESINSALELKILYLSWQKISIIPPKIGLLTNLHELYLHSNLGELSPNFQFGVTKSDQYPLKWVN